MLFTKTILLAATTLVASTSAYYYDSDYSLQARSFDDSDSYFDIYAREAEDELAHELATRDLDELSDLFARALEIRGTIKRPNLGGGLRLTPGTIARANGQQEQRIPASPNGPALPRNNGGSYFPPQGGAGGHAGGAAQGGGSRRDSMHSLFGTP